MLKSALFHFFVEILKRLLVAQSIQALLTHFLLKASLTQANRNLRTRIKGKD
jgi:capsular polysaccharide biosynthesis protein